MTKVLIVDDEVEVRQFLSRSLEGCGYAVREASDGSEALECVATDHPDVVITDLLMPNMDGFELALRIRANPDHAATEVIFFTGRASPRQVQAMAETAGVTQVVTKPATIDEVQGAVDAALHRKHPSKTGEDLAPGQDSPTPWTPFPGNPRAPVSEPPRAEDNPRFRVLFERSLDAILLLTPEGRCVDANPSALELLGIERSTLLKMTLWDLTPPATVMAALELWRQFLAAGRIQGRYELALGNGIVRNGGISAIADLDPGVHLFAWRPASAAEV